MHFRPATWALLVTMLAGLAFFLLGYATALRDPVVRRAAIRFDDWPAGAPPLSLVLISDVHVAGPDMPPNRLARIARQINALSPDLVLIAGDMVSDKMVATRIYSAEEAMRPLALLEPKLGAFAVLGNHDHWRNAPAIRAALRRARIKVLENEAVRAGPLTLGGLDDPFTGRAKLEETLAAMSKMGGPKLILSHSPDPFPALPQDVRLMLAGHTHCGQISLPLIGPVATFSEHGRRYACGRIDEEGRTLIVAAGLGTSNLPLRIGAVPDLWLLTLQGR
jgi:predicted MPP superfamily phosphohydrolase